MNLYHRISRWGVGLEEETSNSWSIGEFESISWKTESALVDSEWNGLRKNNKHVWSWSRNILESRSWSEGCPISASFSSSV